MFYWKNPDTGEIVAVDGSGNPLPSSPAMKEISADVFPHVNQEFEWGEWHGTIVVDQWEYVIRPLYPPGDFGIGEDGSPTSGYASEYASDWDPTTQGWPPFE